MNRLLQITSLVCLILLFINVSLLAQEGVHVCGFDDESILESTDFQNTNGKYYWQNTVAPVLSQSKVQADDDAIHIPVVVHVVHEGEAYGVGRNIEFKRIEAQIDELNKAMMGWDNNENIIPERWLDLVDYPKLKFFLADTDPNGLPTNGVTRDSLHVVNPQTGNMNTTAIKSALNWNTNHYLNIYVLSIQGTSEAGGLVGFSSFPNSVGTDGDGFVVDYRWFGGPGFAQVGFKTTIHEMGHFLGLYHTFAGNGCNLDDGIADTPNIGNNTNAVATFNCLDGYPVGPTTCTEEHQYPNHMDYAHRSCRTMFTQDQSAVMRSVVDGTSATYDWPSRESLVDYFETAVHLQDDDAGICRLVHPQSIHCGQNTISPILEIKNYGINNLNHLWVKISNNHGLLDSVEWVGDLCLAQKTMIQLNSVDIPFGHTEWTIEVDYVDDNITDQKIQNNTLITSTFRKLSMELPAVENFEMGSNSALFPNQFDDQDEGGLAWEINSLASANAQGTQSIYFQNQLNTTAGYTDTLFTGNLNFEASDNIHLCFKSAYKNTNTISDSLAILIGVGCDEFLYEEVWKMGGQALSSAITNNTNPFIPTTDDWQEWSIDLSDYDGSQGIRVAFVNYAYQSETLYLDDIKIKASDNCNSEYDAAIDGVISPTMFECTTSITDAIIRLKNEGTVPLTDVDFKVYIDGILIGQQTWNGLLAVDESTIVYLPSFTTPVGDYELTITAFAPSSTTDENLTNNTVAIQVMDTNAQPAVLQEDFEATQDQQLTAIHQSTPNAWIINSNTSAFGIGTSCMNVQATSDAHWLITENFDYTTIEQSTLTFDYAHAYAGNGAPMDSLLVFASTDCGANYEHLLFQKPSAQLSTYSSPGQLPSATNWQTALIDLSTFDNVESLRIAFAYSAHSGNPFYLDNVNLSTNCALSVTTNLDEPSCANSCDGAIDLEVLGNIGTINYDFTSFPNQSPTNLCAGSYPVTITDEANCAWIDTVLLNAPAELAIEAVRTGYDCDTQETIFELQATNGNENYTYDWADFNETPSQLAAGTYALTVSDNQGCSNATNLTIDAITPLSLDATVMQISSFGAIDGSINIDVQGGFGTYEYQWTIGVAGEVIFDLQPDTYAVTVTDEFGCIITESFEIEAFDCTYFSSELMVEEVACFGENTGSITFINQGGVEPLTYNWSDESDGLIAQSLSAGLYEITATDVNNCPQVLTTFVIQPTALSLELSSTPESAFGQQDGTAMVTATGGTPDYQYHWSNGAMTEAITNLSPDIYEVTVTDSNGCTAMDAIAVNSFECQLDVNYDLQNNNCNNDLNGQITIDSSAFTQPLSIEWSIAGNTLMQNNLATGSYAITINDGSNCTWIETFEVVVEDMEAPFITATDVVLNLDATGEAVLNPDLVAIGSFDNCQLNSITASQTLFDCTNLGENDILLTGIDGNNNSASDNFIVTIIDDLAPSLNCPSEVLIENCNGLISYDLPTAQDNCSTAAMQLISGATNGELLASGTYPTTFQATDVAGNSNTCTFDVIVIRDNIILDTMVTPVSCEGASDGALFVNAVTGPHAPYAFATELLNLPVGITTLNISGDNGCSVNWQIDIPQIPAIEFEVLDITPTTNDNNNGSIQTSTSGGTTPYVYEWFLDGESITFDANPVAISSGTYICQITDANDCIFTSSEVVVDNINSTKESANDAFVRIFPNPVTDYFLIQTAVEITDIKVFNALGQAIYLNQVIQSTTGTYQIDTQQFNKGLYFLELQSRDGLIVKPFIKL